MSRHQASGNCSRCQRRRCATLSQVTRRYLNQLWKVQTGRTHRISSTETSSRSALSASVGQNSRQDLIEHHEEIFGKPHKSTGKFVVMASISPRRCHVHGGELQLHPQRRAFARLRVVLCGSPMSVRRRTRMRCKAEFCSSNGECRSQLWARNQPKLREECSIVHRLDTVALLHTCFPCFQTCRVHVITLRTHLRWRKRATKWSCT